MAAVRRATSDDLGAVLVRRGMITGEQLLTAQHEEHRRGIPLSVYVIEMGYISEPQLATCISEAFGIPNVGSRALEEIPRDAIAHVPKELAERHRIIPLRLDGNALDICLADPRHVEQMEELARTIGRTLRICVVTETALNDALEKHYGIRPEVRMFREDRAPPPSERVRKDIDRTGVFRAPPSILLTPPHGADALKLLAGADTANDVLRAAVTYFSGVFPFVVALGIDKGRALAIMVANRDGRHPLRPPIEVPLPQGSMLRAALERPQVIYRPTVSDGSLVDICRALRIPMNDLTSIPAFDAGRPVFVIMGQGLDEQQVKARFADLKSFLGKVGKALRAVALRAEIRDGV
jgi:hypothetical protein